MRIYKERIGPISQTVVDTLIKEELIEVLPEMRGEVELDVASVLKEYRRTDYELTEKAKDIVANRGLDYSFMYKIKNKLAGEKHFKLGDDAIDWICNQVVELLLQSRNVEEVFGEDNELRRAMAPIMRKELGVDAKLDEEVRKRIKNLDQGTSNYEIEYQKTLERVRAAKGFSD